MKLRAQDGVHGIGIDGREFVNDPDGCIDLPDDLVDVALRNGYEPCSHIATEAPAAQE